MNSYSKIPYILACQVYYHLVCQDQKFYLSQGIKTKEQVLREINDLELELQVIIGEMTGF